MTDTLKAPEGFSLDLEASRAAEAASEGITLRNAPLEEADDDDSLDGAGEVGAADDEDDEA